MLKVISMLFNFGCLDNVFSAFNGSCFLAFIYLFDIGSFHVYEGSI